MRYFTLASLILITTLHSAGADSRVGLKELTAVVEELIKKQNENSVKLDEIKKELISNTKRLESLGHISEENSQEIKFISSALKEIANKLEINSEQRQIGVSTPVPTSNAVDGERLKAIVVTDNANVRKSMEIKRGGVLFRLDSGMQITVSKIKNRDWYTISNKLYLHKTGLRRLESEPVAMSQGVSIVEVESSFAQLKNEMLFGNDAIVGVLKKGVSLMVKEKDNEWYELMEALYIQENNINITN